MYSCLPFTRANATTHTEEEDITNRQIRRNLHQTKQRASVHQQSLLKQNNAKQVSDETGSILTECCRVPAGTDRPMKHPRKQQMPQHSHCQPFHSSFVGSLDSSVPFRSWKASFVQTGAAAQALYKTNVTTRPLCILHTARPEKDSSHNAFTIYTSHCSP